MSFFLRERDGSIREFMDNPDCDLRTLRATYDQFQTVNRLIGGWKQIYNTHIRPHLLKAGNNASVLDIGCGGGDILRLLHSYCAMDGLQVQFKGIEPDDRAIEYLQEKDWPDQFHFQKAHSSDLVAGRKTFTVVISNHLMHHLTSQELRQVCGDAENLAARQVIFSDIERSDLGYACFRTIAPLFFRKSFIVPDGIRSIKRSYRKRELEAALPDHWRVKRQFPFRLLALFDGGD